MTNGIGHRVIAISRIFLKDQWKFLPWWLLSKSEYNELLPTQNVNVARFARNVECDFLDTIHTLWRNKYSNIFYRLIVMKKFHFAIF